ncbi:M23 family metallopeptidase [Adhaeribacter rhizoryzae]|uniref:M23 family metallopeptidase n=1 Tax=Adhaeribacter rhizoryzae TaxID=2607907 RepID=UPI00167FE2CA|nr:M23 family metallopeptidase [Adhaeribacter rhizoryzae]
MAFYTAVYGQFNTIKQVKNLPQVQVDAATARTGIVAITSPLQAIDSTRFKPVAGPTGTGVSMPLSRPVINSHFGYRVDPLTGKEKFHDGIDFRGYADSVMVIMPGEVNKVAYSRGLGNYIEVKHGDFQTTYGHLSLVMVREKMKLNAGIVIGITGSTGRSTGDHLHFAIRHRGQNIDPVPFLDIIYRTLKLQARKKNSGN